MLRVALRSLNTSGAIGISLRRNARMAAHEFKMQKRSISYSMPLLKKKVGLVDDVPADNNKLHALQSAIKNIESEHGKGTIMRLGSGVRNPDVDIIPTGSLGLDIALGIGGLPRGRVIEIFGPESSGKTTLALHVIAESQKKGGVCTFIDAEHALDPIYAKALGVKTESLYVTQPDNGEQALEIADTLVRSGGVDVVVIDSVAALVPKAEIEGEMGDAHMATQARLMSQALRKLTSSLSKFHCTIIFINQIRHKIGFVMGNPEVTSGGNALKFYSSIRLDIRRVGAIKRGDAHIGNRVRVKVAKNKLAPPFRQVEFDMIFGKGIARSGELIDMGVATGVIQRSGAHYTFGEMKLGQGRDKAKQFVEENIDVAQTIEKQIREKGLAMDTLPAADTNAEGEEDNHTPEDV
eukprot:GILK01003086.1.p1 GENE.GILK01003086.1~~GILK01003086.1.p1  ORF type:complete len:408 (+),score=46.26 GILK01003086.1:36-1259(+)